MLTEGFVLSTESEELVEVANIAEHLGITLAGLQMGKRKKGKIQLTDTMQSVIKEEHTKDYTGDENDDDTKENEVNGENVSRDDNGP